MKSEISCGCIIEYDDKFLMLKSRSNYWTVPKGHKKNGESIFDTAIRETFEETGIKVTVDSSNLWSAINYIIPKFNVFKTVVLFYVKLEDNPTVIISNEHIGYQWIDKQGLINKSFARKLGKAVRAIIKEI